MRNIFLIGFMGCGKSTVALELKKIYGMKLCEMDEMIVEKVGKSISTIFQQQGEAYFRMTESKVLKEICLEENQVVSCGGGIVLHEENVSTMKESGRIILLTATAETILDRVYSDDTRPLLKGRKSLEDIRKLLEERRDKYETAADLIVSTDEKSVQEICKEIIEQLIKMGEYKC